MCLRERGHVREIPPSNEPRLRVGRGEHVFLVLKFKMGSVTLRSWRSTQFVVAAVGVGCFSTWSRCSSAVVMSEGVGEG